MTDRRLEETLRHLHPPPGTKLWHGGASVLGALRGLSPDVAAWKPYPDRHSIWALALHVAYWNYAVRRRIVTLHRRRSAAKPWTKTPHPSRTQSTTILDPIDTPPTNAGECNALV